MTRVVVFCMQLPTKLHYKYQYKKRYTDFIKVLRCIQDTSRNLLTKCPKGSSLSSWESPQLFGGKILNLILVHLSVPKYSTSCLGRLFCKIWNSRPDYGNLVWTAYFLKLFRCALLASRAGHRLMLERFWQSQFHLPIRCV